MCVSMQVLQRAAASGVEAFVAYTSDFEKAEALAKLARENTSTIYCMVGQSRGCSAECPEANVHLIFLSRILMWMLRLAFTAT